MKPFCFADGTIVPTESATLHPMDLGLIRGYGIFDFFRTVNYTPLFLENYLDRFITSAEKTFLPLPYSRAQLSEIIHLLIEKNNLEKGGLRMVLSGGISENHFSPAAGKLFIFAESLSLPSEEKYREGIKLLTLEYVRPIADIKTTNYTLPVWHSVNWKRLGAEDVLYHWNGWVSESSRSNFFIVKKWCPSYSKSAYFTRNHSKTHFGHGQKCGDQADFIGRGLGCRRGIYQQHDQSPPSCHPAGRA